MLIACNECVTDPAVEQYCILLSLLLWDGSDICYHPRERSKREAKLGPRPSTKQL